MKSTEKFKHVFFCHHGKVPFKYRFLAQKSFAIFPTKTSLFLHVERNGSDKRFIPAVTHLLKRCINSLRECFKTRISAEVVCFSMCVCVIPNGSAQLLFSWAELLDWGRQEEVPLSASLAQWVIWEPRCPLYCEAWPSPTVSDKNDTQTRIIGNEIPHKEGSW